MKFRIYYLASSGYFYPRYVVCRDDIAISSNTNVLLPYYFRDIYSLVDYGVRIV